MKELLLLLAGIAAVVGVVWLYLRLLMFIDEIGSRLFPSFWRRRPRGDIQTLFSDKDQNPL